MAQHPSTLRNGSLYVQQERAIASLRATPPSNDRREQAATATGATWCETGVPANLGCAVRLSAMHISNAHCVGARGGGHTLSRWFRRGVQIAQPSHFPGHGEMRQMAQHPLALRNRSLYVQQKRAVASLRATPPPTDRREQAATATGATWCETGVPADLGCAVRLSAMHISDGSKETDCLFHKSLPGFEPGKFPHPRQTKLYPGNPRAPEPIMT